ncbi:DUF2637 domain-containing protein [Streptomyces sp. ISL-10]|uniref:DUF2637 domain-containing protein n=1 Tax=Streptomyces sp. ISL-10 TaxID=2819172 RepID=UPI001BEB09B2|nr:DUF2637 domain-containing protein [Streptomyces sp. ISL-10]MBT2368130.1 DUF2637 domain-containing protein [Streptomyces sp. ISL-10]
MRPSLRLDAVLVQAVIAGALSFSHLHDLAEAAGQHGWKAWAYPVSVDLLLVAAWRRLRTLRDAGASRGAAWTWFAVALAASLGANVATAGLLDLNDVPDWLRILVAGWPALAFLGGTLLVHTPEAPRPAPEPVAQEDTAPEVVRAEIPEDEPASAPELPAAGPAVPPALIAHARKLADSHRSATGRDIDADTLRSRLGVPAPMADAIAARLA